MKPFFSVITCTYNRARLLERALNSLLAQTISDWESVIVDDGSIDDTPEVLQQFSSTDARIRFMRRDRNRGLSAARNCGVRSASGRYITFLDSDDEYAADHLATRQSVLLQDDSVRFLHGGARVIGDPYVIDKDNPARKIHINECVLGGTFVIRRDVFDEISGFDDVPYADDTLFFERAAAAGIKIARTSHRSYIYYRNIPGQLTSSFVA